MGDLNLFDDSQTFDRALATALSGRGGLCVVCAPSSGKSALLSRAVAGLPGMGIDVVRLGAQARPDAFEAAVPDGSARGRRRLVLIEDAHLLSAAALDALNRLATGPRLSAAGVGLLLAGSPDLLQRFTAARAEGLLRYPAFTLDPMSETAQPAPRPAVEASRRSIELLPQAVQALLAVVIVGSIAVFAFAPRGSDLLSALNRPAPAPVPSVLPLAPPEVTPVPPSAGPAFEDHDPPLDPRSNGPGPAAPGANADFGAGGNADFGAGGNADFGAGGNKAQLGGPGLLIMAREGDTLQRLYRSVYNGSKPPPFADVERANPQPVRPGVIVVFPTPPDGWRQP